MNEKHRRFVSEFLKDLNATQAAERSGYSPRTAYAQGHRLLKDAEIQSELEQQMKERQTRTQVEADEVLLTLARVAYHDTADLFDEDGKLKPVRDMEPATRSAIQSISFNADGSVKSLRLLDRTRAGDMLARHLGLYKPEVDEAASDFAAVLEAGRRRVEAARKRQLERQAENDHEEGKHV